MNQKTQNAKRKTQNANRKAKSANGVKRQALKIDALARRVWVDKQEIKLSRLEYDVLAYLMRKSGQVVRYQELWLAVWEHSCPFGNCEQRTVRQTLKRLRNKLESDSSRFMTTLRDVGVRLEIQN